MLQESEPTCSVLPASAGSGRGWIPPAILLAGLALALVFTHQDEMDAAIYTVLARNLAGDGLSFHLRFTPPGTLFFEHPPLWLWALALVEKLSPRIPLGLASIPCGMATLWLAYLLGRRLVGARATQLGLVLLAADLPFAVQHSLPRLDAPLTLAFTASVTLLVMAEGRAGWFLAGGLAAGLGTLVKGPPALGAPVAAALVLLATGRGQELRSLRAWIWTTLGAVLPPALFLSYDALALGGTWAHGYLNSQVLASLNGRRTSQFGTGPLYLLSSGIWARARHLAPLAGLALALVLRRGDARRGPRLGLLLWIAVLVMGFGIASRAYWFYVLPAFPPLALLAGAGLDDLLGLLGPAAREKAARVTAVLASAAGLLLLLGAPLGVLRWAVEPCPFGDLPGRAATAATGGRLVGVVTDPADYGTQPIVAEHCRCEVARFLSADAAVSQPEVAAIIASRGLAAPPEWCESAKTALWSLWVRDSR